MRTLFILFGLMLLIHPVDVDDKYGGTLHLGYTMDLQTLDPHRISIFYEDFDSSIAVVNQIFEGLVRYRSGTAEIEPSLAESWEISDDGLVYTFHLRKNVYWHDGNDIFSEGKSRALEAEDFVYSWGRVTAPETLSPMKDFFFNTAKVKEWKAKGSHTFVVTLKQPNPFFLHVLPFPCFLAVPKETEQYGLENFSSYAVGTGPFEVKTRTDHLFLQYNEDYWNGEPYLTEIEYTFVRSEDLLKEFENGSIDWCLIPSDLWQEFSQYNVVTVPKLEILYLGMNCQKTPFSDKRVRQAVNYALDCGVILNDLYQGRAVQAVSILPPGLVCHTQREDLYKRDIEKAKTLLDEVGYTGTPRLKIELKSSESYIQQQINELYKEQLSEIGVELEITYLDVGSLLNAVDTGDTQLFTLGWYVDWPYPDQFLLLFHSSKWGPGGNGCFYAHEKVDALIDEAARERDQSAACMLYQEAEDIILDDSVWVLQWRRVDGYAVQEWIQGFEPGGMGDKYEKLDRVWISADHRQTTRIPQNVQGKKAGLPFCGLILFLVSVVVLWLKRKDSKSAH